jgi:hypothetical protein
VRDRAALRRRQKDRAVGFEHEIDRAVVRAQHCQRDGALDPAVARRHRDAPHGLAPAARTAPALGATDIDPAAGRDLDRTDEVVDARAVAAGSLVGIDEQLEAPATRPGRIERGDGAGP